MNFRFNYKFSINIFLNSLDPTSPIISNGINNINNSVDTVKSDSVNQLSEKDKKIRNLTKKLRQIDELKERQKNGDKLEQTQVLSSRFYFPYNVNGSFFI